MDPLYISLTDILGGAGRLEATLNKALNFSTSIPTVPSHRFAPGWDRGVRLRGRFPDDHLQRPAGAETRLAGPGDSGIGMHAQRSQMV